MTMLFIQYQIFTAWLGFEKAVENAQKLEVFYVFTPGISSRGVDFDDN